MEAMRDIDGTPFLYQGSQVRKTPRWPLGPDNFSIYSRTPTGMHRPIRPASCIFLVDLKIFLLQAHHRLPDDNGAGKCEIQSLSNLQQAASMQGQCRQQSSRDRQGWTQGGRADS